MTKIFSILFLIQTLVLCGQTGTIKVKRPSKTLLVICKSPFTDCETTAFKIIGDTVQIDNCYDLKLNAFTSDKIELVKNNALYSQLPKLTDAQWLQMQNDLDKIDNCDSTTPFSIIIADNNVIRTYSLKRFNKKCYPVSAGLIMKKLDAYFDKKN